MPRTRRSARSGPKREGRIRRKTPILDEPAPGPLSADLLGGMDAYWRAANYLSVGQIYLFDNPLLEKPLQREHVKPRLLGHWGTTPGLNFIYVHLNRVIREHDLDMIYVTGPGHGGPALVANAYLEGTYSEVYPDISQDEDGMKRLFKQFSFPGGIPSHVAPETPGSIHEGGELGYALSHAYGAAFDNPDLARRLRRRRRRGGDRPARHQLALQQVPQPGARRRRAADPAPQRLQDRGPRVLARIPHDELEKLFEGYGYTPYFVEGHDPMTMHQQMAAALDAVVAEIARIQAEARAARRLGAAALAHDRPPHAEGLDRPEGDRRQEVRGLLARPPGADGRHGQARARARCSSAG